MARKRKIQQQELSLFDDASFDYMPISGDNVVDEKTVSEQYNAADNVIDTDAPENDSADHDVKGSEAGGGSVDNAVGADVTECVDKANGAKTDVSEGIRGSRIITDDVRMRAKRQRLKVTFADGVELCHASATETMVQSICKIGVERVASLRMISCHVPLVSTSVVARYAQWTKPLTEGWYLMAQGDTQQKYMQLKSIIAQLNIDARIEIGDFSALVSCDTPKVVAYKGKSQFGVTFSDGFRECGRDHQKVFVAAVEHIGFDKVKNTGLQFSGKRVVTPVRSYACQVQMPSGEWLTVPAQAKDKYKMLRIISSMTRTPLEVRIDD